MLQLTGLNLNAKIPGTVEIFAVPYTGKYPGATCRQRLVIMLSNGTELDCEDQRIHAETCCEGGLIHLSNCPEAL